MIKYQGLYNVVQKHLLKKGLSTSQVDNYLQNKPFKVLVRVNNRIVRAETLKKHNFCRKHNGRIQVAHVNSSGCYSWHYL